MTARELAINLQLMSQGLRVMTGYWIDEAEKQIEAHDADTRAEAKVERDLDWGGAVNEKLQSQLEDKLRMREAGCKTVPMEMLKVAYAAKTDEELRSVAARYGYKVEDKP